MSNIEFTKSFKSRGISIEDKPVFTNTLHDDIIRNECNFKSMKFDNMTNVPVLINKSLPTINPTMEYSKRVSEKNKKERQQKKQEMMHSQKPMLDGKSTHDKYASY